VPIREYDSDLDDNPSVGDAVRCDERC
jgi:hypothetical protein